MEGAAGENADATVTATRRYSGRNMPTFLDSDSCNKEILYNEFVSRNKIITGETFCDPQTRLPRHI